MQETLQCYNCGTENTLGMRFCISCGEKFFYQCPQCNTAIEPGLDFCANCGVKLDWGIAKIEDTKTSIKNENISETIKNKDNSTVSTKTLQTDKRRGLNPWFIAFIIIVILIVVVFIIDAVI